MKVSRNIVFWLQLWKKFIRAIEYVVRWSQGSWLYLNLKKNMKKLHGNYVCINGEW